MSSLATKRASEELAYDLPRHTPGTISPPADAVTGALKLPAWRHAFTAAGVALTDK